MSSRPPGARAAVVRWRSGASAVNILRPPRCGRLRRSRNGDHRSARVPDLEGWIQAVLLVVLFGFFVLGLLAYRTYMAHPPVPGQVVDARREGALHRRGHQPRPAGLPEQRADGVRLGVRTRRVPRPRLHRRLPAPRLRPRPRTLRRRRARTRQCGRRSRTSARTATTRRRGTLRFSAAQAAAFRQLVPYYSGFFSDPKTEHGLRPNAITDPTQLRQLTAFFAWTAWAAAANRPGHDYSYTNNWPPEPRVDNKPTANVIVWSVLSLIALLGGIGVLFAVFGRWGARLGWHGREQATLSLPLARRRRADAGAARDRLVLLRDGGAVPDPDARRRGRRSTTAPSSTTSSASTSRACSRTT